MPTKRQTTAGAPPKATSVGDVLLVPVAVAEQVLDNTPAPLFYLGAAALAVAGTVEWPVVGLVVAATYLARRRPSADPVASRR